MSYFDRKIRITIYAFIQLLSGFIILLQTAFAEAASRPSRYIIQLVQEPLVSRALKDRSSFEWQDNGRLIVSSKACQDYLKTIDDAGKKFIERLKKEFPDARIDRRYRALFNGFAVANIDPQKVLTYAEVQAVRATDGVAYAPYLNTSIPLIEAEMFWLNGREDELSGKGSKIAVIDSGIDGDHPFFHGQDRLLPAGYPRGELEYTSNKIIVARTYLRSDDPVQQGQERATPEDFLGHGTQCAGIAAGNAGTVFDFQGNEIVLSGVAPGASLMNYKVFYHAQSGLKGAYEPEILAALEDAFIDGADVILLPFGAPDVLGVHASSSRFYRAAVDAGVVVVAAAGNGGPGRGTVSYPASLSRVLTAGATAVGRGFAGVLEVNGPDPIPADITNVPMEKGMMSPDLSLPLGPLPAVLVRVAGGEVFEGGCLPFPVGAFDGAVALLSKGGLVSNGGTCTFTEKVQNAEEAGARAVVFLNDLEDALPYALPGKPAHLPTFLLGTADSRRIEQWVMDYPDATITLRDTLAPYERIGETDTVWHLSSRGPTAASFLKPDLVAPGVFQILTATPQNLDQENTSLTLAKGTSMAAAHVAGAVALFLQKYPALPARYAKNGLMGTSSVAGVPTGAPPLGLGAGRIDLGRLAKTAVVAEPPFLYLGEGFAGDRFSADVTLVSLGGSAPKGRVRLEHRLGAGRIAATPKGNVAIDLDRRFKVELRSHLDSPVGEYVGALVVEFEEAEHQPSIRIPYYFGLRSRDQQDLLLLDASFCEEEESDLRDLYQALARRSDLSFALQRVTLEHGGPSLAELLNYRVVLVFTGNDQSKYLESRKKSVLDELAGYLRHGGNLIVAGQGALRNAQHERLRQLSGGGPIPSVYPLADDSAPGRSLLPRYTVRPAAEYRLVREPFELESAGPVARDLSLLSELCPVRAAELPELWSRPFLELVLPDGRSVAAGLLFDPYLGYGSHREAEALEGRVVWLSFGFEALSGMWKDDMKLRQELFETLVHWAREAITINVETQIENLELTLRVKPRKGQTDVLQIDFDDGGSPLQTTLNTATYTYESPGKKQVTIIAEGVYGSRDIKRLNVELAENSDNELPPGTTDTDEVIEDQGAARDCHCRLVGSGSRRPGALMELVRTLLQ